MKSALLTLTFVLFANSTFSQTLNRKQDFRVLSKQEIFKLLGPYPAKGSNEEALDFEALHRYQDSRTEAECRQAAAEEGATVNSMFGGSKGPLSASEVKEAERRMVKIYALSGVNSLYAKRIFNRPRPYLTDEGLKPCIPLEKSSAYPSGHTTLARLMGKVLSHLFPAKEKALIRRADEIAKNRVLGGVHHPSDIIAGKKLGDALADIYLFEERLLLD